MKANVKRISILAVLAFAVLSVLSILPTGVVTKVNAEETAEEERIWTLQDTQNVAAFIQNNLETFVQKYNESREDESEYLHATGVERIKIVNLIEDENYGAYIDFDGDNGYAVVTGDYTVYDLQTEGDLSYLDDEEEVYYAYEKFYRMDENGAMQSFAEADPLPSSDEQPAYSSSAGKDDDGAITDLNAYVNANYPEYTYEGNQFGGNKIAFNYYAQSQTGYYYWNGVDENGLVRDFTTHYEGNCVLTAMYNIFKSWGQYGKIDNIPYSSTVNISNSIENDPLYSKYNYEILPYTRPEENYMYRSLWQVATGNLRAMPTVYIKIRDYAISQYDYTCESGFKHSNVEATMQYIANYYNSSVDPFMYYTYNEANALMSIKKGKAAYLGLNNDPAYIDHGVAIIDYHYYTHTSGWWIFKTVDEIFILEIANGWYNFPTYYDIDKNPDAEKRYYSWNKE